FASITVEDQIVNLDQMILRGASELRVQERVQNEANLDIVFANATIDGDISNDVAGVVSVSGGTLFNQVGDLINDGTFVLTQDSSYSLLGSLAGNGIEGPGGPGTAGTVFIRDGVSGRSGATGLVAFDGPLSLGSTATTVIRIGGKSPGADFDQIVVADTFNAAGTIRFESEGGFVPQPGDVFEVLDFGSVQGAFAAIEFDVMLAGVGPDTSSLLIDGTIRVPSDCLADTNGDGVLTPGDFNAWILAFNTGSSACDQNGDGACTPGDFNAWILNFNAGCP
ncbi:MAG: GC-type dockerin domain-anchored protein, partial [Planctomycetota bacterium]